MDIRAENQFCYFTPDPWYTLTKISNLEILATLKCTSLTMVEYYERVQSARAIFLVYSPLWLYLRAFKLLQQPGHDYDCNLLPRFATSHTVPLVHVLDCTSNHDLKMWKEVNQKRKDARKRKKQREKDAERGEGLADSFSYTVSGAFFKCHSCLHLIRENILLS